MEYGVYGDFIMIYPKPFSIYLSGAINLVAEDIPGLPDLLDFGIAQSYAGHRLSNKGLYMAMSRTLLGAFVNSLGPDPIN